MILVWHWDETASLSFKANRFLISLSILKYIASSKQNERTIGYYMHSAQEKRIIHRIYRFDAPVDICTVVAGCVFLEMKYF